MDFRLPDFIPIEVATPQLIVPFICTLRGCDLVWCVPLPVQSVSVATPVVTNVIVNHAAICGVLLQIAGAAQTAVKRSCPVECAVAAWRAAQKYLSVCVSVSCVRRVTVCRLS